MPGQLLDGRVGEGPDGQGVDILAEDPGEVGDALADAQADVLAAEEDRVAAQPGDRRLEADAGAQRRLLEDQARASGPEQRRPRPSARRASAGCVRSIRRRPPRPRGRTGRRNGGSRSVRPADAWHRSDATTSRLLGRSRHRLRLEHLRVLRWPVQATTSRSTSARMAHPSSIWSSRDRQGRQEPDDVAMRGVDQEPALQALGDDVGGVEGQVQADHDAEDPDLADQVGQLGAKRLEVARNRSPIAARARAGPPPRSSRSSPGPPGRRSGCRRRWRRACPA